MDTLLWAHPTSFGSVPRIWEKFEDRLRDVEANTSTIGKMILKWDKGVGYANTMALLKHEGHPFGYHLANYLVFKKIKK